jgi:type IV secretory pathway TrbF-like protein
MTQATELLTKRSLFKPNKYPDTPYNRAKEEWNDRIGGPLRSAFSWRVQAVLGYVMIAGLAGGLLYKSMQSTIQPVHIRIAENGQPTVLGPVPEKYTPQLAEVRYALTEWLTWTRGVSLDPVLVKQNYSKALCRMRQAPANKLNEWAQKEPRLAAVGRETVAVQVLGVVPVAGTTSYQARWTEEFRSAEGGLKERQTWTATFPIEFDMPKTVKQLDCNPIGLYMKDFQWAREQ